MARGNSFNSFAELARHSSDKKHFTPQTSAAQIEKATAPYNFVSLPDKPLASEIKDVENFKEHILNIERISGEIILEIETLTPIFFGGNSKDSVETFSPIGSPIIAGSSLRGMFKNMLKIVTCGTFRGRTDSQQKGEDFNDEHIYFRCLMTSDGSPQWTKDLCNTYETRMKGDKGKNARPGFLIQTFANKYFIAPSIYEHDRKDDYIMISEFQEKFFDVSFRDSRVYWRGDKAYILTGNQWANRPDKLLDKKSYEKFKESLKGLTDKARAQRIRDTRHGKQIIRFTKIGYVNWSRESWREILDDVRESYEHDRNRCGVNLFKDKGILQRDKLEKLCGDSLPDDVKTLIPCHYLEESGQVTAFGHGQCFRIPYKKSIGDTVPAELKNLEIVDFADAIFGREKFWASRVFFEDAVMTENKGTLKESAAHSLMQPNPTSYQLYLEQGAKILTHWDKVNATLRGYKLYWHNADFDWRADPDELRENRRRLQNNQEPLTKNLKPLQSGTKFTSKIRFQNLSMVELGALMMIFDLNGKGETAAHKIGMGKSLGFGSIRVKPTLFVETDDAYTKLFDDGGFINPYSKTSPDEYIKAFNKYVDNQGMKKIWCGIMNELNKILDWDNRPASDKIKPIQSNFGDRNNLFLQRAVLPTIVDVVK